MISQRSEDRRFYLLLGSILASYVGLVLLLIGADIVYMLEYTWKSFGQGFPWRQAVM
ncbi:MAG: hypothetical protein GF344_16290, partial [Chitinivibrionales bacterium]|nr:hypothetical protein [Chitinivibrionales bacterium]MBD3358257.1 hypothetical protein [Chitinivibrionales bacterium]